MATYTTKVFTDSNWISPADIQSLDLMFQIPAGTTYANGDIVRFSKLRPDLDGLGAAAQVGAAASDGLVVRFLNLQALGAGNAALKQISPYRTIVGLNSKNEATYYADAASATVMYAFFDKNDVCLATNSSTASPPAGTVKTVQWPALPYIAAVIATAAAAGVVAVATANTYPNLPITIARKRNNVQVGNDISRYYGYNTSGDGTDVRGTAGKT